MLRYQKQLRIATERGAARQLVTSRSIDQRWSALQGMLILAIVLVLLSCPSLPLGAQSGVRNAPAQLFLLPTARSAVVLQTQTADIRLSQSGGSLVLAFDGFYRLRNSGNEALSLALRIVGYSAGDVSDATLPADLIIEANGAPLVVEQGADGPVVRVQAPPDRRIDLRLRYSMDLGSQPLVEVSYPVAVLDVWPGSVSQRTTIVLPATMPPDSWLTLQPADWTYAPPLTNGDTGIQWLFEGRLPETPVLLRAVHPVTWQQISLAESAVRLTPSVRAAVQLGDLYSQVLTSASDQTTRSHFYAQALAAYTAALRSDGAPGDQALAHLGQAALYRKRLLDDAGVVNPAYAQLLVEAAAQALTELPVDHPRREELSRWLDDGLSISLADARNRRDWRSALDTLDLLTALPPGLMDPQFISDERRRVTVEQSLQLLEEGQRDAAVAISGSGIVDENLQPPPNNLALFAAWQVTMTLTPGGSALHFVGIPAPGADDAAKSSLEELAGLLHEAAVGVGGAVTLRPALEMHITLPGGVSGLALANATPLDPNWALVRTLLAQTAPVVEQESRLFQRIFHIGQSLDLRSAGDQWRRMARNLEEQADLFQAQSAPGDRSDPAVLEGALRTRIQAANYRATATNWLNLAENSQVIAQLVGPGGLASGRAWQATVDDSPQKLLVESQTINWTGVWLLAGVVLGGLVLLAGILWSLL